MAAGAVGRLYTQLRINNVDLPLQDNLLSSVHMVESTRIGVPMLTFIFVDQTKFLTRNNLLVDAAPIEFTVEKDGLRSVYYFRMLSFKETIVSGGTSYTVQAYIDAPLFWSGSTFEAFNGTSSGMLQEICNRTGLTYEGPATADTQLWFPYNTRFVEYAREVSERAWTGDSSCFQMAVLASKVLRLKDISKVVEERPVQVFSNKADSETINFISDFDTINKSGIYNSAGGYKGTRVVQSLLSNGSALKTLTFKKNTQKLMMNSKVQDGIEQSQVVFTPIDVGNVSDTYEKALYQNRRLSNMFSFGLQLVTGSPVVANVMDVVNCEISKPGIDGVEQLSGKYLLVTKTLYIEGLNFYQKLEVFRHGLNTSREQTLI